jgi:hypothetical protein
VARLVAGAGQLGPIDIQRGNHPPATLRGVLRARLGRRRGRKSEVLFSGYAGCAPGMQVRHWGASLTSRRWPRSWEESSARITPHPKPASTG